MAFFEHDDCSLHYEEYGLGEPVLLLHGLGSSCQDWEYQIPALARQYRVIVMDMRGHGRSDKPYGRYSIQAMSNDVEALIEHLHLGPVHTVQARSNGLKRNAWFECAQMKNGPELRTFISRADTHFQYAG